MAKVKKENKIESFNVDVKGPYTVSSFFIGSYKVMFDGREMIIKKGPITTEPECQDIITLFTYGVSYNDDEIVSSGSVALPIFPKKDTYPKEILEALEKGEQTLELNNWFSNLLSIFFKYNGIWEFVEKSEIRAKRLFDYSLSSVLGNCLAKYTKRVDNKTVIAQRFDCFDIRAITSNEDNISSFYTKKELDSFYDLLKHEKIEDGDYGIIISRPLLKESEDGYRINKLMLTYYVKDCDPILMILSFKETTEDFLINRKEMKSILTHEII